MEKLVGSGWLYKVCQIELVLHNQNKVSADSKHVILGSATDEVLVDYYRPEDVITGSILLCVPDKKTIWHDGIFVAFQEVCDVPEMFEVDDFIFEKQVAEPGYISGEAKIDFELDLREDRRKWRDNFRGELFSVKHSVSVTVKRPWYTFDILCEKPVYIQSVESEDYSKANIRNLNNHVLTLPEFGTCVLDYLNNSFALGCVIHGTLNLSNLKRQITLIEVGLIQLERCRSYVRENLVIHLIVFGTPKTSSEQNENEDDKKDEIRETLTSDASFEIDIELINEDLGVSINSQMIEVEDDKVYNESEIHHFLQLSITDSNGHKFSKTNEIFLFRKHSSGLIGYA